MKIWTNKSAMWPNELWREGIPIGNGIVSALINGGVGIEEIRINRFDRWENGKDVSLPDVSNTLAVMRELIAKKDYISANTMLADALKNAGYAPELATPMKPQIVKINFNNTSSPKHYKRGIDVDTGEAFVSYKISNTKVKRKAFVDYSSNRIVFSIISNNPIDINIDLTDAYELLFSISKNEFKSMCREEKRVYISGLKNVTLVFGFQIDFSQNDDPKYDQLISLHLPKYKKAIGESRLELKNEERSTQDLLDEAFENEASAELIEKLWRFGRYVFISGTAVNGYPFAQYGLWNGVENAPWSQNVANENVQMIYWHTFTGGIFDLVKPLIHYYFNKMSAFRVAARNLFGCNGIFVSVYTTPKNSLPAPVVPVIVNYISAAGWLSNMFYEYYMYSQDQELFENEILPFMLETANFYVDYVTFDSDGNAQIVPSVSPENSPKEFIPNNFKENMSHPNPVVKNSTADYAIIKELLKNLLKVSDEYRLGYDKKKVWENLLVKIPDYQLNEDGAVKEWMTSDFHDNYYHRHLSHIYPLFPGKEITDKCNLYYAFGHTVDLRVLGGMSGWSFPHMACIYARLHNAEKAAECIDELTKSCLLPNLFTLHNDWRQNGITLSFDPAPIQLDALMGTINAIQEMLFFSSYERIEFLPACPKRLNKGSVYKWYFPYGFVDFNWDRTNKYFYASVTATRSFTCKVDFPEWSGEKSVKLTLSEKQSKVFCTDKVNSQIR